jgi:hypothetical protein
MTKIFKFEDYKRWSELAESFLESIINPPLLESNDSEEEILSILKNLQKDLKFNVKLIFTFGTGIASMYPIVQNLIQNQSLKIDMTTENIALLTLTSVCILSLEIDKDPRVSKDDIKNLLTELKLRGIGNGIVKKMVNTFKSLGNLFKILFDNTSKTIRNVIEMFAYTSLLIPTMNALSSIVSEYNWTMDSVIGNLSSLGVGILTFLGKNGWDYLSKKLKKKTELNPDLDDLEIKSKNFVGLDTPLDNQSDLIKEQ